MKKNILFFYLFLSLLPISLLQGTTVYDFLPKNFRAFDVGANIGTKTDLYLLLGAEEVVCVEPQPSCIAILNQKFAQNPKVTVLPLGVADKKGALSFFLCADFSDLSSCSEDWMKEGRFKNKRFNQTIVIHVTTLDDLIEIFGTPDFCKIDVEGFEASVLAGLSKPIPYLSFEFTKEFLEKKTRPCIEHLTQLGFRSFNVAYDNDPAFIFNQWMDGEALLNQLKSTLNVDGWGDIYARYAR